MKYIRSALKWGSIILIVFGVFFLFTSVYIGNQEEVFGDVVAYPDYVRFMRSMAVGYTTTGVVLGAGYVALLFYDRRRR